MALGTIAGVLGGLGGLGGGSTKQSVSLSNQTSLTNSAPFSFSFSAGGDSRLGQEVGGIEQTPSTVTQTTPSAEPALVGTSTPQGGFSGLAPLEAGFGDIAMYAALAFGAGAIIYKLRAG